MEFVKMVSRAVFIIALGAIQIWVLVRGARFLTGKTPEDKLWIVVMDSFASALLVVEALGIALVGALFVHDWIVWMWS